MKLKCPGCSKLLQIPETAAGKVVKCTCGKQLRVPASKTSGGTSAASRPAAPRPAPTRPAAPVQPQPAASSLGVDADFFNELTETDLAPVAVVSQPKVRSMTPSGGAPNPYAPTITNASAESGSNLGPLASIGKRFANFFIDGIFTTVIWAVIGAAAALVMVGQNDGELSPAQIANMSSISSGLGSLSFLLYYCLMEAVCGATLAKFITGTRVVAEDGSKAGFGKIVGRTLARIIPLEPFSFLFGDTRTGWHDSLSGTRVVDIRNG